MKRCELVIFDMDGTILNTLEDLADSTNYALRMHHMPERSVEEIRMFVGNGIAKLIQRAVAYGTTKEQEEQVLATFRTYYGEHCAIKTRPYDGILKLLRELRERGFMTAVVSNKADFAVQSLVSDYFPNLFDVAVGEREGIRRKPAPDSVEEVLMTLGVHKEDAVYVGDSDVDLETARNAGMDAIAVEWGFRGRDFLVEHGACVLIERPEQILNLLEPGRNQETLHTANSEMIYKKPVPHKNKVGLVLEGGGMRGLYTAAVLDVFMQRGITVDSTVGVSAGATFGCNFKSRQQGRVLRYNLRFCKDKRFASLRNWFRTGSIYTKEFAYGELPFQLDVFDSLAYDNNPMDFTVVATDADTGEAVYHLCPKGDEEDIEWMRASASIPIACAPVEIDGHTYVDGGVADSIPVQWMAKRGFDKLVVILTRPLGYRKPPRKSGMFTKLMLRKYPKLIEAMGTRHERYNATLDWILQQEKEGNLFVIRPSEPIDMPYLSPEPEKLQRVYDLGKKDAESVMYDLLRYLEIGYLQNTTRYDKINN